MTKFLRTPPKRDFSRAAKQAACPTLATFKCGVSTFAILLALFLFATSAAAQSPTNISIQMDRGDFRITGWAAPSTPPAGGWSSLFNVYAGTDGVPPLLGSYFVDNGSLVFRPRFPLARTIRVRAIFHPPNSPTSQAIEATFDVGGAAPAPTTRVNHIYPSTDVLPANELKFYLLFTAPMGRGNAWPHIHLLESNGAEVRQPFLQISQELWNPDNTRLTVLFDPGRIKRGVVPNVQLGMALQPGKRYTLLIDRDWLDARGAPLVADFRKSFRVAPTDRTPIDPNRWRVTTPQAGTSAPLVLDFPKPLDDALLKRMLSISGPAGSVAGVISLAHDETEWRFIPSAPWKSGSYQVIIDAELEDLAGNKVGVPFDVDTFQPVTKHITTATVSLPFQIH